MYQQTGIGTAAAQQPGINYDAAAYSYTPAHGGHQQPMQVIGVNWSRGIH